jgi:hypothetical protein
MLLNFKLQQQLLDEWCWAAVTSSVSLYYNSNSNWQQSTVAAAALQNNACSIINQVNPDSPPSGCDEPFDITASLGITGNYAGLIQRALTFDEVVWQINNSYIIVCQIYWQQYGQSHFVTIYGYDGTNVIVGDPEGQIYTLDYNAFVDQYKGGVWVNSIGTTPA